MWSSMPPATPPPRAFLPPVFCVGDCVPRFALAILPQVERNVPVTECRYLNARDRRYLRQVSLVLPVGTRRVALEDNVAHSVLYDARAASRGRLAHPPNSADGPSVLRDGTRATVSRDDVAAATDDAKRHVAPLLRAAAERLTGLTLTLQRAINAPATRRVALLTLLLKTPRRAKEVRLVDSDVVLKATDALEFVRVRASCSSHNCSP